MYASEEQEIGVVSNDVNHIEKEVGGCIAYPKLQ